MSLFMVLKCLSILLSYSCIYSYDDSGARVMQVHASCHLSSSVTRHDVDVYRHLRMPEVNLVDESAEFDDVIGDCCRLSQSSAMRIIAKD